MGTHYIPRNVGGENRILFVFSPKALIYTCIGGGIGFVFYLLFNALGLWWLGATFIAALAGIGFAIGTFKVPKIQTKKFNDVAGEKIDDVIMRYIKFQKKKNTIYVYKDTEAKGDK